MLTLAAWILAAASLSIGTLLVELFPDMVDDWGSGKLSWVDLG